MKNQSVIVFSGEDINVIKQQGGTGNWVIKTEKLTQTEYVLVVRNAKKGFNDDVYEHGQAFLLGKIQAIKELKDESNRKLIQISEFIELPQQEHLKDAWRVLTGSQRYPVSYKETSELIAYLRFDLFHADWQKMQQVEEEDVNLSLADIINEARNKIAKAAKVDKSKVNIQISF